MVRRAETRPLPNRLIPFHPSIHAVVLPFVFGCEYKHTDRLILPPPSLSPSLPSLLACPRASRVGFRRRGRRRRRSG